MKIVTWNVNSLKARQGYVERWLDAEAPDVLCVQELKLDDDKVPTEMFTDRGYDVAIHGQPRWNGVLIASKTPLEDVAKGLPEGDEGEARLIAATASGVRFVNLYCPQGQAADSPKFPFKLGFFAALRAWLAATCDPSRELIVLGDLNIAPEARDIWDEEAMAGVPSYHPLEHEEWGKLMAFGLEDAVKPFVEPGTFSFWDYRGGCFHRNQGMRIDHVLVTKALAGRVTDGFIQRPYRKKWDGMTPSDHAPVGIVLD